MGKITGFMEYKRQNESKLPVVDRIKNYKEFNVSLTETELKAQGARCMGCGIPFCHSGCPLGNYIPDFNHAVYEADWKNALNILQKTNNFPEFTGRLCPAPCEEACVLGINEDPITIENIEKNIVERGFLEGLIVPIIPEIKTGKRIAIVGSGPAGLAAAQQLNRAGHSVTLFERDPKLGGLLRYGIPDFKMEKWVIDRRLEVMEAEGIIFKPNTHIGKDITAEQLQKDFDAILLTGGSTIGRTMNVKGADLKGVNLAMTFLKQQNQLNDNLPTTGEIINAKDKNVIVIGGGDTGSDCIGTSVRHGAKSITNFEILTKPTPDRSIAQPWPYFPVRLKTTTSHEEGSERFFSISTKEFVGDANGNLKALITTEVKWEEDINGRMQLLEVPNTEKEWPCELVFLALGFVGPETDSIINQLGLKLDERGNVLAKENNYQTSTRNVFVAGDMRRGQSLIVWAISEGREAAHYLDKYLMGNTNLPTKGGMDIPRV